MNGFKRIPKYFSLIALFVSALISLIKGITPVTALYRIVPAVIYFYTLGFCISTVLGMDKDKDGGHADGVPAAGEREEEFEELEFPVIETAEQDS